MEVKEEDQVEIANLEMQLVQPKTTLRLCIQISR